MSLTAFFLTNPFATLPIAFALPTLFVGLYFVVRGAEWLIEGASSIATHYRVPAIVIGLTIVAFGTSMPEFIVNLLSSATGNTGLAIGNIVGSNIANILLILGATALYRPLTVKENTVWKEIPMAFLAMVLVWVLSNDVFLVNASANVLDRIDGFVLLAFFIIFLYYTFGISKIEGEAQALKEFPIPKAAAWIVFGILALTLGGKVTVDGATAVASGLGVSNSLIGLTLVALGTSLPELVTSFTAARRGLSDLAIGNAVGSNIFNVFWVLGVSAMIRPLPFNGANSFDVLIAVIASLMLFIAMFTGNVPHVPRTHKERHTLSRVEGFIFLVVYFMYIGYVVWRG